MIHTISSDDLSEQQFFLSQFSETFLLNHVKDPGLWSSITVSYCDDWKGGTFDQKYNDIDDDLDLLAYFKFQNI